MAEAAIADAQDTTLQGKAQDSALPAEETTGAGKADSGATASPDEPKTRQEMEKSAMDAILKAESEGRLTNFAVPEDDAAATSAEKPKEATPAPKTEERSKDDEEKKVAAQRIKDAQRAYHASRQEIARQQKRIEELEAKLKGNSDDQSAAAAEAIYQAIPEKDRAAIKEMGELNSIISAVAKTTQGMTVSARKAEAAAALAEAEERHKANEAEMSRQWEAGIKAEFPDFQNVLASPEFADWKASHPGTLKALLADRDTYDPEGAKDVLRAFHSARNTKRDLGSSRTLGQDIAARPGRATRSVLPPSTDGGDGRSPKSREELERESMAAILREERQKRRSFGN